MDVFVTPEMSNLAKLSAICLGGPIGGYEAIGTLKIPNLQQLDLYFNGHYRDQHLPDQLLPIFSPGALSSLTKLEIRSFALFEQVDALPWHVTTHKESAKNTTIRHFSATSPASQRKKDRCCTVGQS